MITPLKEFATKIRIEQIRCIASRGFGHIGGTLSATDVIAALYGRAMNIDPDNPCWEGRDRLVCSKGHAGPAIYAALALKGYFPEDWLLTLNRPGTRLPSHCDMNLTPGVDMTTGSLGQGASTAAGMALALKNNGSDAYVYLIMGDGESNEGQVWEMALFAASKKLGNLIAFIDYNRRQLDGKTDDIIDLGDLADKFVSFNWHTQSIDGGDPDVIADAIDKAKQEQGDRPAMIVLNTIKGAGIPEVEQMALNHHIDVDEALAQRAIALLETSLAEA